MPESAPGHTKTPMWDKPLVRAGVPIAVFAGMFLYYLVAREGGFAGGETAPPVRLAYVEWSSALASVSVVQAVLEEKLDVPCVTVPVSAAAMWQSVASGDTDATVAAWLPDTHKPYYDQLKDRVVNLGPNLHVDRFNGEIVGIDPGAGIMRETQNAIEDYGLDGFRLVSSSAAAMAATLGDAIRKEQWIVVTAWTPHWIFHRWDLQYLDDPRNTYGTEGHIATIVRTDLQDDRPRVYAFLDRFHWRTEDMQQIMAWNQEGTANPEQTARRWIENNPERVTDWIRNDDGPPRNEPRYPADASTDG